MSEPGRGAILRSRASRLALLIAGASALTITGAIVGSSASGELEPGSGPEPYEVLEGPTEAAHADALFHGGGGAEAFNPQVEEGQVVSTASGTATAIIPAEHGVCLGDGSAETCADSEAAAEGRLMLLEACMEGIPEGHVRVAGVVSDDVSQVRIEVDDGDLVEPEIEDNAYSVEVPAAVHAVSVVRDGGTITQRFASPVRGGNCYAP